MHGKDDFFALQNLALAYEILQDNDRLPMGADEVMIRLPIFTLILICN